MLIKIASRGSALALWQSEHIKSLLQDAGHEVEIITMKTKGDVILDTPLAKIGGKGLFTKELEVAMINGKADIAVHSLKDVPTKFEDGLELAAVCTRDDVRDAMLSQNFASFDELPKGAVVGTTSLRRRMQILALRPDLNIKSLRGNVNSRIAKLKDGQFDAIILAMAGINRLNLSKEVNFVSPLDTICAMGQGALGVEIASHNKAVYDAIKFLNDENTIIETTIERAFVDTLNGGCQAPIGINAKVLGDKVLVKGILGLIDGSKVLKDEITINKTEFKEAGVEFANKFLARGAKELLAKAEAMANEQL